ncbi:hypothetical protein AL479_17695 [Citrobacter amalonaticus]|nr:hypothetical protein AL479_17695 [Citrobacter amalonaticus]
MRIPDRGSTTGAARWTEWPQAITPAGRAKRVNPPLTAIFEKELVRKYGLFFRIWHTPGDAPKKQSPVIPGSERKDC